MGSNSRCWQIQQLDQEAIRLLCDTLGLHRLTAAVLVSRGQTTPDDAKLFLDGGLAELADPFCMSGIDEAVRRLMDAVHGRERVLIYGDYDADGVTSTALLSLALQRIGLLVEYYIPSRLDDGYGLHIAPLERYAAEGGKLVVTVDCGINSFAEMLQAQQLGLDLIITDHHECFAGERPALAVLNPKQMQCTYPERNLAGVGVAWTLVRALYQKLDLPVEESAVFLDLVAVGTIADVVTLQGENRILVRLGLERLCNCPSPGLRALSRKSGLTDTRLTATQVAFTLAPRLNAPGRLGDASPAVDILMAKDEDAERLAVLLDERNNERRQVERVILEQARSMARERENDSALVLWQEGWHPGVVGIVAGRLAREYDKPAVLIAIDGEEAHGSARCIPGYDLVAGLSQCVDNLLRFGGHPEAAGFSLKASCLDSFREVFCSAMKDMAPEQTELSAVAEVGLDELSLDLVEELSRLQPFGQGNPEPVFVAKGLDVVTARHVGSRSNHLQLKLRKKSNPFSAIYFGAGEVSPPAKGELLDIAFIVQENSWQGRSTLSLNLRGLSSAECLDGDANLIMDRRGLDKKQPFLLQLATQRRLVVWVNTKAALDYLRAQLPAEGTVITQLGRDIDVQSCDALAFYHLPYDRGSVEQLLARLEFMEGSNVYLLYGQEELLLNERVFAASIPNEITLKKLAACLEKDPDLVLTPDVARRHFPYPVTQYLLKRAATVFRELGGIRSAGWAQLLARLDQSQCYLEGCKNLTDFRNYQSFWWQAAADTLTEYILNPTSFTLPEGAYANELERTKRAN
jgi:single-stranded-DNA-specific exonuclease